MPREFLNNLIFGTVEEEAERERAEGAYKPGKGGLKILLASDHTSTQISKR